MSAFIVDNRIINDLLAFVGEHTEHGDYSYACRDFHKAATQLLPATCDLTNYGSEWPAIGQAIYDLNVSAVSQRYGGEPVESLPGPIEKGYVYDSRLFQCPKPLAAYKALQCLLYQCSEGDVPETPLYKALDELSNRIAHGIVSSLPEYDALPWG